MNFFVYRNSTVEHLFDNTGFDFSDYNEINNAPATANTYIWLYLLSVDKSAERLLTEIAEITEKFSYAFHALPSGKPFYVFTLFNFNPLKFDNSDFSIEKSIHSFNETLINLAAANPNLRIIDMADFASRFSLKELVDWKYFFSSGIILNPKLSANFKQWLLNNVEKINHIRKKCLVIDLDNTIWGGILGEDGEAGIQSGGNYPGNAFQHFQENLVNLAKSGIILAVCSKNNEDEVLETWKNNPNLILKKEHIAAYRINWNNKADNIRELAKELNIGTDSMVFIDDYPAERELVRTFLPEVETPDFPDQPYLLPVFFADILSRYFQTYGLTKEDVEKTAQYKSNAERETEKLKYGSMQEYLSNLNIEITISKANKFNIGRIAQMTQKTNQFNLTTHRYSEHDINNFIAGNAGVYCLGVKDKFGDSGISGLAIIVFDENRNASIDTFLLSCRILGKNIEFAFIDFLLDKLQKKDVPEVFGAFIPTTKNIQAAGFYEQAGFELSDSNDSITKYKLDLSNYIPSNNYHIKVTEE